MTDIKFIARTFQTVFAQIMPSRTAVASFCKTFQSRYHHRFLNPRCRCMLGTPPTHTAHPNATILAPSASADVQFPITPHRC